MDRLSFILLKCFESKNLVYKNIPAHVKLHVIVL